MEFTKATLRRLAGDRPWRRGVGYFHEGAVISLAEDQGVVVARARGTHTYKVKLWMKGGELNGDCNCPFGQEGEFCKHCVAAGLAYLEQGAEPGEADPGRPHPSKKEKAPSMEDLRQFLHTQDVSRLVEIIMAQAVDDEKLLARLMMALSRTGQHGINSAAVREAIDHAVGEADDSEYGSPYKAARNLDEIIGNLRNLLNEGHATEVRELVEYAMDRFESISRNSDDSYGGIGETFEALRNLHHDACARAKPDPERLARQLFEWELEDYGNVFYHAAETYADVLGDKGLAAFQRLAQAAWDKLPPLTAGQREDSRDDQRYHLQSILEDLARRQGDLEALVAVKRRDLSAAHHYLAIAQLYRENRKYKQAAQWAEDGLNAFPERPDHQLRTFLAEEYHRQERHDEAMHLIWANLKDRPDLHSYQELKAHAERMHTWPDWRERALAFIRKRIAQEQKNSPLSRWSRSQGHSLLVRIHLWEKDPETAWAEAQAGGCTDELWMELARGREKEHPADAVPIYRKHVELLVGHGGNDNYKDAVTWIKKIWPLMKAAGQERNFPAYLQTLRAAHGRKRNFLALLNRIQ